MPATLLQETMVTKGVASVPSPVRNLVEWSPSFDHDAFVSRVAEEFADVYGGSAEPIVSLPAVPTFTMVGLIIISSFLFALQRVDESELDKNKHAKDLSDTMQVRPDSRRRP